LLNKEWKPVEDRFEQKLASWIGKLLFYEDRLVLINYVLTSLFVFLLYISEMPNGVSKRLDFYISRFFGKVMSLRRSIDLLGGTLFAGLKTKEV
jgi:hypothetical protein